MIAISRSLTCRMSRDFSYLSASCPAVAESSTNGAMNTAPARFTSVFASAPLMPAAWNARKMTSAFLNRLSFSAPANCVQKNGAKRRSRSRSNWLGACIGCRGSGAGRLGRRSPRSYRGGRRAGRFR